MSKSQEAYQKENPVQCILNGIFIVLVMCLTNLVLGKE